MSDSQGAPRTCKWIPRGLGIIVALIGALLGGGGVYLATLGGSTYFALMGLALVISGVLIAACKPAGAWLYALAMVGTVIWALVDVGLHFWPLVSRLFAFFVIGLLVALTYPAVVRAAGGRSGRGAYGLSGLIGLGLVATVAYMFVPTPIVRATSIPGVVPVAKGAEQKNWSHWGNTTEGQRFAALDQINKDNVSKLQVAWTFNTGDIPMSNGFGAEDQNTPLQIGDTLYVCTPHNIVIALDADKGTERWRFDPKATAPQWQRCRGLGYFEDAPQPVSKPVTDDTALAVADAPLPAACRKRIVLTTIDARLITLDAETGKPCADFGDNGTVGLKTNMGEVKPGFYTLTAAPLVAGELIVVGGRVADNIAVGEPGGVVRAFNVRTGELVWAWDPGRPSTTLLPPPGETYVRATPNVWASMAFDEKLGMIYLPTGNTTPDQWGGQRTELDDKYSSSVVALDAKTGREKWIFQTARHDLWDYDVPAQPTLVDVPDGKNGTVPALIQITKQGQIFMLNRETGQPIADVEERPVPQGNARGERYSPTQPFSTGLPSIGAETLTESSMWGATPFDQLICRIQFKKMRYDGMFTPIGEDVSLQWPGSLGGMNWGGAAVDPTTGYLIINDMRLGLWSKLIPREQVEGAKSGGTEMGLASQTGTPYLSMRNRFLSPLGIPCQAPPFGTMSAIDLKSRQLAWQVPLGTVQDTGPLGIKMHLPIPIGMPTLGGSLVTQSGLVFFSGTQDYYLRAMDIATGKEIWKARLPVGTQSTPITYVSPKTGKQYVVLTAGGARQSPDRGDNVIAYTLP